MQLLALDAGGTEIKAAMFADGRIGELCTRDSRASEGKASFLKEIFCTIESFQRFDRLAVSVTGQVDAESGSILYANSNVPFFTGTPLRRLLEERYGVPVTVENDVRAAALAEYHIEQSEDRSPFLCLTYGTGVGSALIIDGKLYRGRFGRAVEAGGLPIHIGAETLAYEQAASTSALVRNASRLSPDVTDGKAFFSALRESPRILGPVLDDWVEAVALGLAALISILDPAHVVLGGGIMQEGGLTDAVRRQVFCLLPQERRKAVLRAAHLGNTAGLYGMHLLAERRMNDGLF